MKAVKAFRYSGSKTRFLKHYRRPPPGTKRIVEPFLGSGAYGLSTDLPVLGYEQNEDVVEMWRWLQSTTPGELKVLGRLVEEAKTRKADVRTLGLDRGPQTYVRINCAGLVLGQMSAWVLYPQNKLPIEETISALVRIRDVTVLHADGNGHVPIEGDLLFVDPPYIGTNPNYGDAHETFDVERCRTLTSLPGTPKIVTYGDGAQSIFPALDWQVVARRKVPNVRKGGTTDRTEWVSYVDWPPQ